MRRNYFIASLFFFIIFSFSLYAQEEQGIASWYGPGFHGKKTASGETYDMYRMTAAHKTLPFHSIVQVTDLDTGKSVRVRINDRGPFVPGRVIDLSYAAARALGIHSKGTARVALKVLSSESGGKEKSNSYYVMAGSFKQKKNAVRQQDSIWKKTELKPRIYRSGRYYRLILGPWRNEETARDFLKKLEENKIEGILRYGSFDS